MARELSVREIQSSDFDLLANYWFESDKSHLEGMGVDLNKMPARDQFLQMLSDHYNTPIHERKSYCIIWLVEGIPVGHSNTNPAIFGKEAFMHLHIWNTNIRSKGMGIEFVKMTLPFFFENLQLKKLYCQPYALNPAPNKSLEKVGFEFVKEYITIPGFINFEQPVKLWEMSLEKFKQLVESWEK